MKVAVLGAGSWGTALAAHMAREGHNVTLWSRREAQCSAIRETGCNPSYLKDVELPKSLVASSNMQAALDGAELVLGVVPTAATRSVLSQAAPLIGDDALVVSATKGVELESLALVSEIYEAFIPRERFAALGGPSFAREVALGMPTAVSVASHSNETAVAVQSALNSGYFRVYRTDDVIGVELAGALKNVIAIAAGISDGLGFGLNARAGLITRGVAEISRLAVNMGAHPMTLAGLSGMGDLVLTCTGNLSRNRQVGLGLGQGKRLDAILEEMAMVAEGVYTAKSARALSTERGVDMPISESVYRILHEGASARDEVQRIVQRPLRHERDDAS